MADLDLRKPFTRRAALLHGVTLGELRGPRFQMVFRGVHVSAQVDLELRIRAHAAILLHRYGSCLSHETSAALQDLPVPHTPDVHVLVSAKPDRRPQPGLRAHVGDTSTAQEINGLLMTVGTQLFLQLADRLPLIDLVVVGDALVRRGSASPDALVAAAEKSSGRAATQARRAAAYVRERVDSPMESRLRMLLVLAGFPEPIVNGTVDGRYRPDLSWPAPLCLIVEYDGRHHRADLDQWDHDIERTEWFRAHDWEILTVVARDIFQRPDELLKRVYAAWIRRGGAPFRLCEAWRAHFEVRASA